jgi:hypothetical protein
MGKQYRLFFIDENVLKAAPVVVENEMTIG